MRQAVPILTYHSLDESGSVISVAPRVFAEHMRLLARRGFLGITLSNLLDAWEGRVPLPPHPVVLTFDDGFANLLQHAAPVIWEHGFCATVFAISGWCGRTNGWPTQGPGIPRLPLLAWSDLAQMATRGWEIGAHTINHPPLTRIPAQQAHREIVGSKAAIEDRLGKPVTSFAYPYGLISPPSYEIVRNHFRGACSVDLGVARACDDLHQLRRLDVYYFRSPIFFRLFGTVPGRAYTQLCGIGRMVRRTIVRAAEKNGNGRH
jgi:peptidoglycan/xylan/chitin deacetylase (PgdA/CDA1 family)